MQLAAGNGDRSLVAGRPLKRSALDPPIQQPEAVVIPEQHFELVALAVAKHKEAGRERIQAEALLHERGEGVDGLAQIYGAASQINVLGIRDRQHGAAPASACTTSRSNWGRNRREARSVPGQRGG